MSILKQLEESKLTPEEIQELIALLTDVIPKVYQRLGCKVQVQLMYHRLNLNQRTWT
jgi:hypothetical protein